MTPILNPSKSVAKVCSHLWRVRLTPSGSHLGRFEEQGLSYPKFLVDQNEGPPKTLLTAPIRRCKGLKTPFLGSKLGNLRRKWAFYAIGLRYAQSFGLSSYDLCPRYPFSRKCGRFRTPVNLSQRDAPISGSKANPFGVASRPF